MDESVEKGEREKMKEKKRGGNKPLLFVPLFFYSHIYISRERENLEVRKRVSGPSEPHLQSSSSCASLMPCAGLPCSAQSKKRRRMKEGVSGAQGWKRKRAHSTMGGKAATACLSGWQGVRQGRETGKRRQKKRKWRSMTEWYAFKCALNSIV